MNLKIKIELFLKKTELAIQVGEIGGSVVICYFVKRSKFFACRQFSISTSPLLLAEKLYSKFLNILHLKIDKQMLLKNEHISIGFILAGCANIFGVLIFSKFLTNEVIPAYDGEAMSNFGLLMILVWGLVFLSASKNYDKTAWLVGAFVIEKLVYALHWSNWMMHNNVSDVFAKDKMAGIFYSIYGINDWLFFLFFLVVFVQLIRVKK